MAHATTSRGRFPATQFLMTCGIALCVSGCFLNRMPDEQDLAPARPVMVDEAEETQEPAIEEPIRPIGDEDADEAIIEPPIEEFGDLNEDGVIDEADVEMFRLEFGQFDDEGSAADFDGDGQVTLVDFQIFLTMTMGEEAR